jgi:hypothetical protein
MPAGEWPPSIKAANFRMFHLKNERDLQAANKCQPATIKEV